MLATDLLRFFGIALIVNSHLGHFYPIPQLSADGFLGNSIFFSLSGVGLALSKTNQKLGFWSWFWRRLTRIYPSLLLVIAIFLLILDNQWDGSFVGFIKLVIWPTQFGFIAQLLFFYIPYYFISKLNSQHLRNLFFALFIPFGIMYFLSLDAEGLHKSAVYLHPLYPLNWIFYFQMMVMGGLIAKEIDQGNPLLVRLSKDGIAIALFLSTFFAYITVKALVVFNLLTNLYFALNLLIAAVIFSLFLLSTSAVVKALLQKAFVDKTVRLISALTLEIYLVHACLLEYSFFSDLVFPLNIAVFVSFSLLCALLINLIAVRIQLRLRALHT